VRSGVESIELHHAPILCPMTCHHHAQQHVNIFTTATRNQKPESRCVHAIYFVLETYYALITMPRLFAAVVQRAIINCSARGHRLGLLEEAVARSSISTQIPIRQFAKVSSLSLTSKKRKGKKITMVTAYDYPSAVHVARSGIDIILVGDSVAMVELGHETTQPMTVETMIHHCQSVKRGLNFVGSGSMLVGDMPFGTYEFDDTDIALRHAYQFVKDGGCDAVKLEVSLNASTTSCNLSITYPVACCGLGREYWSSQGCSKNCGRRRCVPIEIMNSTMHRSSPILFCSCGPLLVAVMGHVGLTPQAISVIGGFRAQGTFFFVEYHPFCCL
jgi:ketopantoate hydroxymethyltransferase